LFPEDIRNRRKLTCGNFLRKLDNNPQEIFGQCLRSFPCPNILAGISAGNDV